MSEWVWCCCLMLLLTVFQWCCDLTASCGRKAEVTLITGVWHTFWHTWSTGGRYSWTTHSAIVDTQSRIPNYYKVYPAAITKGHNTETKGNNSQITTFSHRQTDSLPFSDDSLIAMANASSSFHSCPLAASSDFVISKQCFNHLCLLYTSWGGTS